MLFPDRSVINVDSPAILILAVFFPAVFLSLFNARCDDGASTHGVADGGGGGG
jgi:hypothetical protein